MSTNIQVVKTQENSQVQKPSYIKLYFFECLEAMVAILILRLALEKEINVPLIIKASMLIGLLTFLLEQYNPEFKQSVRQGITFTVGSQILNAFS